MVITTSFCIENVEVGKPCLIIVGYVKVGAPFAVSSDFVYQFPR